MSVAQTMALAVLWCLAGWFALILGVIAVI